MSRTKKSGRSNRDGDAFVALPWVVLDSPAYARLSHPARGLLLELCRQYVRDNNGRLMLSRAHLEPRGWKSSCVIDRAKKELLAAGFIHETVKGHRPNKASWFALTFYGLDRIPGFDAGAVESFRRGAYREAELLPKPKPTREQLFRKWDRPAKNDVLSPSSGTEKAAIASSGGVGIQFAAPSHGAISAMFTPLSTPSDGHHLDMPSLPTFLRTESEHGRYLRLTPRPRNLLTDLQMPTTTTGRTQSSGRATAAA